MGNALSNIDFDQVIQKKFGVSHRLCTQTAAGNYHSNSWYVGDQVVAARTA